MDIFQAIEVSPLSSERVRYHLSKISEAQSQSGDIGEAIAEAITEFNKFFLNYGKPYFKVNKFHKNIDTPNSKKYNETLETLKEDIDRLYNMAEAAANSTVSAYNYSSITSEEIKNLAAQASSKVLDLKILNDFVKGTTIVAGDDFIDTSKIDTTIQPETTQAEVLEGASSIGLKAVGVERVSRPDNTSIRITPISPAFRIEQYYTTNHSLFGHSIESQNRYVSADRVNTEPTPDNIERFYEGHFYAPVGEIRPEGGSLNFKYIVDPADLPPEIATRVVQNNTTVSDDGVAEAQEYKHAGYYSVVAASEEDKQAIRLRMIDGKPETFWECEYVCATPSLIDTVNIEDGIVDGSSDTVANVSEEVTSVSVNVSAAEALAKAYDFAGRDLIIHIDYEFDQEVPMNFVVINPVQFHTSAFAEVIDVATSSNDKEFETVDGFDEQMFDKILTPEANKIVNNEIVEKTFAPSNFAYQGLGVFSFPMRIGNKLRVTIAMKDPVLVPYERIHILLQETFLLTNTTTVKKSLF